MPDALHDGEGRERRHRVNRGPQKLHIEDPGSLRENEADGEYDYPDWACRQPNLALHTQSLGPRTRVGDHQRAENDDHAQPRPTTVSDGSSVEASSRKNRWASVS